MASRVEIGPAPQKSSGKAAVRVAINPSPHTERLV
jgi:hypothetical protein